MTVEHRRFIPSMSRDAVAFDYTLMDTPGIFSVVK